MELATWLKRFRALHDGAKQGALSPADLATYRAGRDELARALLAAQKAVAKPGEAARRQLRASRALQVEIDFGKEKVKAMTLDLSAGGFGVLLARPPVPGDAVKVSLRLPGQDPVNGVARIADVKVQPGNARAAMAWTGLPEPEVERIEMVVFDTVLDQLG
jgi:hypothetical protein